MSPLRRGLPASDEVLRPVRPLHDEGIGVKFLPALLLAASLAHAAVTGTVQNKTTGQPAGNVSVTLTKLGQGMEVLATTTTDAQGRFKFDNQLAPGPHLLQANFQQVNYSKLLTPNAPTENVPLDVYNTTSTKPQDVKVTQHMMLLEPADGQVTVNETVIVQNAGNTTSDDPKRGTFRFAVPPGTTPDRLSFNATGPNGMPLPRTPQAAGKDGEYQITFPVKPGESRFEYAYVLPLPADGIVKGRVLHEPVPLRLVTPSGVTLEGDGVVQLGVEPTTQAAVYGVEGASYAVKISGTGQLRGAQPEETPAPEIQPTPARLYTQLYPVLGILFGLLTVAFVYLYRRPAAVPRSAARS